MLTEINRAKIQNSNRVLTFSPRKIAASKEYLKIEFSRKIQFVNLISC